MNCGEDAVVGCGLVPLLVCFGCGYCCGVCGVFVVVGVGVGVGVGGGVWVCVYVVCVCV